MITNPRPGSIDRGARWRCANWLRAPHARCYAIRLFINRTGWQEEGGRQDKFRGLRRRKKGRKWSKKGREITGSLDQLRSPPRDRLGTLSDRRFSLDPLLARGCFFVRSLFSRLFAPKAGARAVNSAATATYKISTAISQRLDLRPASTRIGSSISMGWAL